MDKLLELLFVQLEPWILGLWNSLDALKILTLILLVVLISLVLYREHIFLYLNLREKQDHDVAIFRAIDQITAEVDIDKLFDDLAGEHVAYMDSVRRLYSLKEFASKEGNKFLDRGLGKDFHTFYLSVVNLSDFMYKYFAKHPVDQQGEHNFCIALTPYFNFERGAAFSPENNRNYEEKEKTMLGLARAFIKNYQVFRRNVKKKLLV